jgi:type IV fimbrial biogenesis protein FimT
MHHWNRPVRGVTLVEMPFALAVLAVLLVLAMPAFGSLRASTTMRAARDDLATALASARNAAVIRNARAVVCPSADARTCRETTAWHDGWIVFLDANGDGRRDADEVVLSASQGHGTGLAVVSSSGRQRATFRPDGSAAGSNLTLTICARGAASRPSTLVLNNAGRVRVGRPSAAQLATCLRTLG